ncbi:major capsid protein [Tortoise microvirus 92]|nr:major capsid protein [Tortoise microvirus 92]
MKRFKHSLSHYKLMSFNMGDIVPIGLVEVNPGDTIQHSTSALLRLKPMLAPVMHPTHVKIHHWFVPHRLLWDDWEKFITGGEDGMDASVFPTINLTSTGFNTVGGLPDYFGIQPGVDIEVSALPFRAYAKIFNECYRDQDLEPTLAPMSTASGVDTTTLPITRMDRWDKDYVTGAKPWAQKGGDVMIPISPTAPIVSDSTPFNLRTLGSGTDRTVNAGAGASNDMFVSGAAIPSATNLVFGANTGLEADLQAAIGDINDLKYAFAIQRYREARARYGSRLVEYLRYLGIKSSDARLQRPEYLGGGKETLQFSEVLATAEGTDTDVGDMKGHGIAGAKSNRYRYFAEEHGFVVSVAVVKPINVYTQGAERHWFRRTKEDFWQKELEHVGAQPVYNKEVYIANDNQNDSVFGYTDRYAEYRSMRNTVSGEFRTGALDYWHMARTFTSRPVLNGSFIRSYPTDRIFAVQTDDKIYGMIRHSIQARRLIGPGGTSY